MKQKPILQNNVRNKGETHSLKALACKVMERNTARNNHETRVQHRVSLKETHKTPLQHFASHYNERTAIHEYEGNLPRHEAERLAYLDTLRHFVAERHPAVLAEFEHAITHPTLN